MIGKCFLSNTEYVDIFENMSYMYVCMYVVIFKIQYDRGVVV